MSTIHLTAIGTVFLFFIVGMLISEKESTLKKSVPGIYILFGFALLLRLYAAYTNEGFSTDMNCFAYWSNKVFDTGFRDFYAEGFSDYPPGYIYLLYPIGALVSLCKISYLSPLHRLILRMPAIIADLAIGGLLYREAKSKYKGSLPTLFCSLFLLNPVIILNSSIWGQVDSVYTLLLIVMCVFLVKGKLFPSYLCFCLGVLIKPQMLMFAPILFLGMVKHIFLTDFSVKKLLQNIATGLGSIAALFLLMLPFGIERVISLYVETISSYPYAAINAFNFWGFFGKNYIEQTNTFIGIPYQTFGTISIVIAVLLTLFYAFKRKFENGVYNLCGSMLMAMVFTFSVRMHERYLYPVIPLLLFALLYKPSKKLFFAFIGFSTVHFYNTAWVLYFYDPQNYDRQAPVFIAVSAATVAMTIYLVCSLFSKGLSEKADLLTKSSSVSDKSTKKTADKTVGFSFRPSLPKLKHTKLDWLLMISLTVLYAFFAFRDLGNRYAPETSMKVAPNESLVFSFNIGESGLPSKMYYFMAPPESVTLRSEATIADVNDANWYEMAALQMQTVFAWKSVDIPDYYWLTDYIPSQEQPIHLRFTPVDTTACLKELVFTDESGNIITPLNAADYPALFDEADFFPVESSFRDSMYFDEIYHARTAYEYIHGERSYENTHPPLGKILISLGIRIFGMNPFGWRFMGTLFGVFMVPLVYVFAKSIFNDTLLAFVSAFLFTFDFMHFAQTRLATIDVYITFFVILMYFFMWSYCKKSIYDTPLRKTFLPLGLCGIAMGLGIASKWTGIYSGAGLAVIFFATWYYRYVESKECMRLMQKGKKISLAENFKPKFLKTVLFCIVFFVIIPCIIYALSYIPFRDYSSDGLLTRLINNQKSMFSYHSSLTQTHPYSSTWYQWPLMTRPIWYYSRIVTGSYGQGGLREGISAFGNPLVWWIGIPAAFYMIYLLAKQKDRTAGFLLIGYLAQYLPWFFVTRVTFIYHYFPSVIFVVLMITYSLSKLKKMLSKKMFLLLCIAYCLAAFMLFLLFLPVLSGSPVPVEYVDKYLRWVDTWVLASR